MISRFYAPIKSRYQRKNHYHVWIRSSEELNTENKCYILNLQNVRATKIDQKEVANHFNKFVSTVAENIGKDTVYDPSDHPSLIEIKKQNDCTNKFVFEKVTTDKVEKIINNINIKKATGAVVRDSSVV